MAPTLWRTCRVLANSTRQRILETLFDKSPLDVTTIARSCGLDLPKASHHLRALQSRGLLAAEPVGRHLFYRPCADPSVAQAAPLLAAIESSVRRRDSISTRIRHLTAFTHARRIHVLRAIAEETFDVDDLALRCRISRPALLRHLYKLKRRSILEGQGAGPWRLARPARGLPRDLLGLALGIS